MEKEVSLKIYAAVATLAEINARGEMQILEERDMEDRRLLVDALEKIGVVEIEEPRESGKFMFTDQISQDMYVVSYNSTKKKLSK
jgi:hypothetical protein